MSKYKLKSIINEPLLHFFLLGGLILLAAVKRHYKQVLDHGNPTDTRMAGNLVQAGYSFGLNYFVFGHRLKPTGEASLLSSDFESDVNTDGWRYRLQLDVSF